MARPSLQQRLESLDSPPVCIQDDHVPAVFECHSENLLEEAPAEVSEIPAVEAEGCLSGDAGLRFGKELAIGEEAADDFARMSDLPTHELQPHLAPPGRLSFSRPAARRLDAVVLGGILSVAAPDSLEDSGEQQGSAFADQMLNVV
jgi:hypothetical protein